MVGYLALVPLVLPAVDHVHRRDRVHPRGVRAGLRRRPHRRAGGNSLWFAVGAAALSLAVGTALAYFNVRTDVPFKGLFFAASIIPLIIPGILYTIAWIFLASP